MHPKYENRRSPRTSGRLHPSRNPQANGLPGEPDLAAPMSAQSQDQPLGHAPRLSIGDYVDLWPFTKGLTDEHIDRLLREVNIRRYPPSAVVCQQGDPALHWVGVLHGAVKIEANCADGRTTTLATMTRGGWFGEGSVLKQDPRGWPFCAVTLLETDLAVMPAGLFHSLLDTSLPFSRFIIDQLNARLAQFIERCEHGRLHSAEQHIAHCIHEFSNRQLYPEHDDCLPLSQQELAHLAGVSRQVVNRVLRQLQRRGIVRVAYGSIALVDPAGLRSFSDEAWH